MKQPDVDQDALRAKLVDVLESAIDQVEALVADAPRPSAEDARQVASRVRESRVVEKVGTAIAAGAPIAMRVARQQMNRRNAKRAMRFVPLIARRHPLIFGASVVGGALLGMELLSRARSPRDAASTKRLAWRADRQAELATGFDLDEEVARMEGEGGDTGAVPRALPGAATTSRTGNGSRAGTR
jgi:hypothetical protein